MTRIFSLKDLDEARRNKKAVFAPRAKQWVWAKPLPAAFVINLNGAMILELIHTGLYIYEKEETDGEK